jgi:hypothetical protein
MPEANVNTTDIEVPQTMNLDALPAPEPIKTEKDEIKTYSDPVREAIFAKRREFLEQEMIDQGLEPQSKKDEPEPVATQAELEPIVVVPVVKPEPTEQEKFLLNVYGQTKELTKDELIREAQKGMAATQIFQEGHRMRDEALQIAHSVKQHLQPAPAAKENPPQPQSIIDDSKALGIAKRINYGSEEDQINAIKDLGASIEAKVRGQVPAALPPEQLIDYATRQAIAAIDLRTEQDTLKTEFKDILEDRYIAAAADAIANDLAVKYRQEGTPKSRIDLFREAGTIARDKYLKAAPAAPVENSAPPVMVVNNTDKLERKRAAPKPPVAANKVAVEPPPAYGVGVSSIVNQMRKARGQPVIT